MMRAKFTQSFKVQAVQKALSRSEGCRLDQFAHELGVGYSTLQKWIRQSKNQELDDSLTDEEIMKIENESKVQIEKMNKENLYYKVEEDSITNKITFSPSGNTSEAFDFNYTTTEKTLEFSFIHKNDTISGQTKRLGKEDFLLTNRGFHWISEYPYNR